MKNKNKQQQLKRNKNLFNFNKKVDSLIGTKRDEFGSQGSAKGVLDPHNVRGNPTKSRGAARMEPRNNSNMGPMGRQGEKKR
jgi:hypothetical protein